MELKEQYSPRQINHLGIFEESDWQLKTYSILQKERELDNKLIKTAQGLAIKTLPRPAKNPDRYGLGFINVHQGKSYDFVSIAYWAYNTELKMQSYIRGSSTSYQLEAIISNEISSDIWDIQLISFETKAWIKHILKAEQINIEDYLNDTLSKLI